MEFSVTRQAGVHADLHGGLARRCLPERHIAVAFRAIQTGNAHMPSVGKEYMIREHEESLPWDFLIL
jgi:hypothetical protein